ncbi:hypothetical protein [Lapidilactobacillus salsurivasis]
MPSNRLGLRGSVVKLSLAALPLRTRLDFETSRELCGLAQNDAHHVPVRNSSPSRLRPHPNPANLQSSQANKTGHVELANVSGFILTAVE